MNNDWKTFYREACIADEARAVVSELWIPVESGSEAEAILDSVKDYLMDRFDIAITFCGIANELEYDNA